MGNLVAMKCPQCGAEMMIDPDHEFTMCEFCGSKQFLNESDEVKAERLRRDRETAVAKANAEAEIEKKKIDTEYQLKKDEIRTGVDTIRSGVDMLEQEADVIEKAKGALRLAVLFAVILLAIPALIVGCIIFNAIG